MRIWIPISLALTVVGYLAGHRLDQLIRTRSECDWTPAFRAWAYDGRNPMHVQKREVCENQVVRKYRMTQDEFIEARAFTSEHGSEHAPDQSDEPGQYAVEFLLGVHRPVATIRCRNCGAERDLTAVTSNL